MFTVNPISDEPVSNPKNTIILRRRLFPLIKPIALCLSVFTVAFLTQAQSDPPEQGLLREVYTGIPGTSVIALTSNPKYPNNPDIIGYVSDFEAPVDVLDNYGQRLSGYVVPPTTGDYTFWIASDDGGSLFLSTDSEPVSIREIARVNGWTPSRQWTREPNQRSEPIRLVAGRYYYVEALMKEQGGGDNLAVRWQMPDGTIEEPIPGNRLLPFGIALSAPTLGLQPASITVEENQTARFSVAPAAPGPVQYQWQRNGVDIQGANSPTLEVPFVPLAYDGSPFRCRLSNSLGSVISQTALLKVTPDQTLPEIVSAQNLDRNVVEIAFSEPMEKASAETVSNYSIQPGVTVSSASLQGNGMTVRLTCSPLTLGTAYTVTVQNLRDRASAPNRMNNPQQGMFTATDFLPLQIGTGLEEGKTVATEKGLQITGAGLGIDGASDSFFFNHQTRSGNFDLKLRVQSLGNTDPWASAGLMARVGLDPSSIFGAVLSTPSISGVSFSNRPQSGASAQMAGRFPSNYPFTWLRLRREGPVLTGYAGYDGSHWKELGSLSTSLPSSLQVGFALASGGTQEVEALFGPIEPVTNPRPLSPINQREPSGPTSRATGLVLSEIHYHPQTDPEGRQLAFIELHNSQPFFESIGGWRLSGDIDFTFPEETQIPAGGFLLVAKSPGDLEAVYGKLPVLGPFDGDLSRSRGRLRLRNRADAVLLEVEYEDQAPWPPAADGAGHSLVLARPSYGASHWKAWEKSSLKGGSPGYWDPIVTDAMDAVVINEFLAHTDSPMVDFIELYNAGKADVDLSGATLTDSREVNKYSFPEGTSLASGAFLVLDQDTLGFNLDSSGDSLYLVNAANSRVVDAVRFGGQSNGVSTGRSPDGAADFHPLQSPTPGQSNAAILQHPITINEIMFHPISGDDRDEFVELFNDGDSPVDLSNWRLTNGIGFNFQPGTTLGSKEFLVVSKDPTRLIDAYPSLTPQNTVGPFSGTLSNKGEKITLVRPDDPSETPLVWVLVDEVTYSDGGKWGEWADRGGSSLELTHPKADNRRAYNWEDSEESSESDWVAFEHTGVMDHGRGTADEIQLMLLGAGECLVDDLEVISPNGINLVRNGTFESGLGGWVIQGNHVQSRLSTDQGFQSNNSLRLIATGGGDNGANRVESDLISNLGAGQTVTIRGKAKWLTGHTNLLARVKGNYLEAVGNLAPTPTPGTPGSVNSRYKPNPGPALFDVTHSPILPAADEKVVVTARAQDPQGIRSLTLSWRRDPLTTRNQSEMRDDGQGDDRMAGDGVFTASIPGQSTGVLVGFMIVAQDQGAPIGISRFPLKDTEEEALIRFGEEDPGGNLPVYRMWFTQDTINTWSSREQLSNEGLDGTFVLGNHRVIYNIKGRYRGSPFIRPGYGSPLSGLTSYVFETPKDDELFGTDEFNLDGLEQPGRDPTLQREKMSFWIGRELGIPYSHQSYVYLYVNGRRRGQVYSDSHNPSSAYVENWFADSPDGELFKIDDWFEFNDAVSREFNENARLQNYTTTGGVKKLARYRWSWEKKFNGGLNDDHSSLFALVDALNSSSAGTLEYENAVESVVDVDQWARVFATRRIVADWDGYSYSRGKNQFAYLPAGGKWKMLLWDLDFSLGGGSRGAGENLFAGVDDPTIQKFYAHPAFRRSYLAAMWDALQGPLDPSNIDPLMDAHYTALVGNRVNAEDPSSIKNWLQQRRNTIQSAVNQAQAPFQITSNNGNPFQTNEGLLELTGTAPLSVRSIQVNGRPYPVRWIGVNEWQLQSALNPGNNEIRVSATGRNDEWIEGATDSIHVTFNGAQGDPVGNLILTEIMYNAAVPGAEFVEIHNLSATQYFDLTGYRLDGVDFLFPSGSILGPNEYGVIVKDAPVFIAEYGTEARIFGAYNGSLDNGGETLRLVVPATQTNPETPIDQVRYDDEFPWPVLPDGKGPSLQLIDKSEDNNRIGNWGIGTESGENFAPFNLFGYDTEWTYFQEGTPPSQDWMNPDFDDSSWPLGKGLLYVESSDLPGPKSTPLTLGQITYYFRRTFEAATPIVEGAFISKVPNGQGTGLTGRYWKRAPGSITSLANDAATITQNTPPSGTFLSKTIQYSGNDLTPVSEWLGNDASTLSPPNPGNLDDGLIELKGWLAAPQPGTVQFRMESDDGSVLKINNIKVIDNDGSHGAPGPSPDGSFHFERAGLYPIEVQWYNGDWTDAAGNHGGASLLLTNNGGAGIGQGPGGTIPSHRFYNVDDLQRLGISSDAIASELPNGMLNLYGIVDDGFVAYLNGEEILRVGLPEGVVSSNTVANRTVADASIEGPFFVPGQKVRPGRNVLAVEVHQTNAGSSDIVFGMAADYVPDQVAGPYTPGKPNSIAADLPKFERVWISEIQSNASSIVTDNQGDSDPWLELVNQEAVPVSVGGWSLTVDPSNLNSWTFPANATIPADGYLVVWLDGEPHEGGNGQYHASFKADFSLPGMVVLSRTGPQNKPIVMDALAFPALPPTASWGRLPDEMGLDARFLPMPTPGARNVFGSHAAPIVINEWQASNNGTLADPEDGEFDDWFELYNPGTEPVDLVGYGLSDDPNRPDKFIIPPGYRIEPKGFLLVWADEQTTSGPSLNSVTGGLHVNFKLNQEGEAIGLYTPDGKVLDLVEFGAQITDQSQGRLPDGNTNNGIVDFVQPTPGRSNRNDEPDGGPRIDVSKLAINGEGRLFLEWSANPGTRYLIESSRPVLPFQWSQAGVVVAEGHTASFTDPVDHASSGQFYRIKAQP